MPNKVKPPHHRGTYHVRSRKLTAAAKADPTTRCWRCHLTLHQSRAKWGRHVHWQAGHTGLTPDHLAPECSHCNASHGAKVRNARKGQKPRPEPRTALTW